jgi:S1-C subfamily serine protease
VAITYRGRSDDNSVGRTSNVALTSGRENPATASSSVDPGATETKKRLPQLEAATPWIVHRRMAGSGFLIEHDGRLLVVTNRHVVWNCKGGIAASFRRDNAKPLTVPARVVAVHRAADIALIDVSASSQEIRNWGAAVVTLAPRGYVPKKLDGVTAIGHPGGADADEILFSTVTNGTVSGVGRTDPVCGRALQITAAINHGNSGGPLFDDDARVVGVNTYGYDMNSNGQQIHSTFFALEVGQVHELIDDTSFSMPESDMKWIIDPTPPEKAVQELKDFGQKAGYRFYRGSESEAFAPFMIPEVPYVQIDCEAGHNYAIVAYADQKLRLRVIAEGNQQDVGKTENASLPAVVKFECTTATKHYIIISHESDDLTRDVGIVAVFEK